MTIVYNLLPILILSIPYLFLRNRITGKFYFRVLIGLIVFYLLYWVLPMIFQINETPLELTGGDFALGVGYIIAHFGSLIVLFLSYPLVTLPFIFFVAPFISILMVWRRLMREEGSTSENLKLLTYQFEESPYDKIKKELMKSDWSREKDILKLLIVLLPISLYLVQVILSVLGLETFSLTTGETALGWFLEILFVYLAIFIFSIELLFTSQIALKGRQFGETIRTQTYKSLYSVGAPISILSIVLFIFQYTASLPIIIYFFAYFLMASIIFILFLKIFEPISLLIFVKLIHWWKNKKRKIKSISSRNIIYVITFSFIAVLIFLLLSNFLGLTIYTISFPNDEAIRQSARFDQPQSLFYAFSFDLMNIFSFIVLILLPLTISTLGLVYTLRKMKSTFLGFLVFLSVIVTFSALFTSWGMRSLSLIQFSPDDIWITGQTSFTSVFGFNFFTLRSAGLDADLTGLVGYLSIPYVYTRYIFNIIIWSLAIFYMRKSFKSKNLPKDEKMLTKLVFSRVDELMHFDDYKEGKSPYLISKGEGLTAYDLEKEREEIIEILNSLDTDKLLRELIPPDEKEKERFYFTLKYLYTNEYIDIYKPEFSLDLEIVEKQGLYIIYDDGRGIFNYNFSSEFEQDPGLISGMFSAITSFIKETTRSQDLLKTIDHGDIRILIEYGNRVFGALFIKGKQSTEVRTYLREFVTKFENKYAEVLKDWSGALIHFKEDHKLVEQIFKE